VESPVSALGKRIAVLEQTAWDRRKRQIVRDAFADVAQARGWTPDRVEREVQAALDEFNRMEPTVKVMCQQGATLREVVAWMAAVCGFDADELSAEAERSGVLSRR
jgi:hypothetical protein